MTTWVIKYFIIITILQLLMIPVIMSNFHPLNMMIMLIVTTILVLVLNIINSNMSIYSMMIFISIIGGIMIMFLYFTSLINNYKMKIYNKEKTFIIFCVTLNFTNFLILIMKDEFPIEEKLMDKNMNIYMIYIYPYNSLTYMSVIYLFYCLILITKMCSKKFKPLRKMKN